MRKHFSHVQLYKYTFHNHDGPNNLIRTVGYPTQTNVQGLTPRCDKRRFDHLLDPSIYDKYPGLQQSPTCYDLVACNPKSSCTGNNQCGLEYQWMRPTCVLWQEQNPNRNNCTSDDQCRQRSGSKQGKAQGVFEQVYLNRCICKRT